MNLNKAFEGSWFIKLILVMWLVSSVFVVFLLNQLDSLVHGDLYNFGLKFSYEWATPYWSTLHLIYVCLVVPTILSGFMLSFELLGWLKGRNASPTVKVKRKTPKSVKERPSSVLIACSHCGKRFSRPILMLDFSCGKTKLVNVCPFCGAKLGENNQVNEEEFEVRIKDTEEEFAKQN